MTARVGRAAMKLARRYPRAVRGRRQDGLGRGRTLGPGLVQALDSLPHGLCVFDAADRLLFMSDGFRRLFGSAANRIRPGLHAREVDAASAAGPLPSDRDPNGLWAACRRLRARGTTDAVVQTLPDGRQIARTLHPQAGGGWTALWEDVTERRRTESLLRYMAHHDPLTGLPNRYLFAARLDRALARRDGVPCALLSIDLDGFKPVNDRHGHAMGDALLRQLAERLREGLGAADIAARLGGDEFTILLGDAAPAPALGFALHLQARLAAPYDLGAGSPIRVGAAIGVACAPLHATRAQALAERADAAMYTAKRLGHPCLWDEALILGPTDTGRGAPA
ncbi:diguanylate cyclase domain-containing protein [Methylobacterium fujisawaense]|uniref:diguanylate cyclase domain-containing protein n=1 Tax=Methylobacterium fujisawaense TaxID=107400 RepID=UPI0036FD240A